MTKEDKVKAIQFLNETGAFLITKSGDKVCRFLVSPSIPYIVISTRPRSRENGAAVHGGRRAALRGCVRLC
jgi:hypothetical protein